MSSLLQCTFVYPYPSVSALAGGNSDHDARKTRTKTQTLYLLKREEKLRPWSEFLGTENSDHGLSFGCFWGRGRRGGSHFSERVLSKQYSALFLRMVHFVSAPKFQAPKKCINIKNFNRNLPRRPPPPGAPDPPKFFMHGASLPFKIQKKKKTMHKEFQGGGPRVPKIVYALVLCVFYLLLKAGLPPQVTQARKTNPNLNF